jgi:sirohydrochlorin cobaltochelatase
MTTNATFINNAIVPSVVLLVLHGSQDPESVAEAQRLTSTVAQTLQTPVRACFLEFNEPSIAEAIRRCMEDGFRRLVVLPLFLGAATHQKNDVPAALNWAKRRWPQLEFCYGVPLGVQYGLVEAMADRVHQALQAQPISFSTSQLAVAVIGRGTTDPDNNADVAKMARLLWEGRQFGWVETGYYSQTAPDVTATVERCIRGGAQQVVVLPYLLFTGRICKRIVAQAQAVQERHPAVSIVTAAHLGDHPGVVQAIVQRYEEAVSGVAAMTCDLCKYRQPMAGFEADYALPQHSDFRHGLRGIAHAHHQPIAHGILPPRYIASAAVSAAPMPAAPLVYDEEGGVAWEKLWGADDPAHPFCELALAGGPPHRGSLLEPVAPEEAKADWPGYCSVLDELTRAITRATGLNVVRTQALGWIGVQCDSEEMALWLLRAIVVENISVRREASVLFLPAGPAFRVESEIRNIVTALAKTHHYWKEHLRANAQ